jgi:hypothetical protein
MIQNKIWQAIMNILHIQKLEQLRRESNPRALANSQRFPNLPWTKQARIAHDEDEDMDETT